MRESKEEREEVRVKEREYIKQGKRREQGGEGARYEFREK